MLVDGILPIFRDEESEVLDLIESYFAGKGRTVYTGLETPDRALETTVPYIRVGRTGGAPVRGSEHTDRPVLDIDVITYDDRAGAKQIAKEIEQLLMSAPRPLDRVNVLMSPQKVPWVEGSKFRRYYASYQLSLRR
jgi:hypothetical protein